MSGELSPSGSCCLTLSKYAQQRDVARLISDLKRPDDPVRLVFAHIDDADAVGEMVNDRDFGIRASRNRDRLKP
jgi:hypothetical protein